VWVVSLAGANGQVYKWNGSLWTAVSGSGVRIAVDPSGNPWVIAADNSIWRYVSSSFQSVSGAATDIGIAGDGMVWITGATASSGGYQVYWFTGNSWQQVGFVGTSIAANIGGRPWVVDSFANIIYSY